jgi:hypothetical protein
MFVDYIQKIKDALDQGAYSTAINIGTYIKPENNSYAECCLLTLLAQIGMTDLNDIKVSSVFSDLSYASKEFFNSLETISSFETTVFEYLRICAELLPVIKSNYDSLDKKLQQQYIGSSGISLDSDDPNEKAKAQREREHNNQINKQRHALKLKYESACKIPFDCILVSAISSEKAHDKHYLSLDFCDQIKETVKLTNENTQTLVDTFVSEVKKARNDYYWQVHTIEYQTYIEEKASLNKLVSNIINQKVEESQHKIESANQEKAFATKERRRYSIFNHTDRKPLSTQISQARKIIKLEEGKLAKLNKGICADCEIYQMRIKEIEDILSKQY